MIKHCVYNGISPFKKASKKYLQFNQDYFFEFSQIRDKRCLNPEATEYINHQFLHIENVFLVLSLLL